MFIVQMLNLWFCEPQQGIQEMSEISLIGMNTRSSINQATKVEQLGTQKSFSSTNVFIIFKHVIKSETR